MAVALGRRREDPIALRTLEESLSVVLRPYVLGEVAFDVEPLLAGWRGTRQVFILRSPAKRLVRL